MAEIAHQGRVVEAREGMLVLGPTPKEPIETTHEVKAHDAAPGDYVIIYDDGQVDVMGRAKPLPDNVTAIALPMSMPEPDHS